MVRSEPAIIAGIAKARLGDRHGIDWDGLVGDYDRIRDKIEAVFPDFFDFNARVRNPGGFRLDVAASFRRWKTVIGKATFLIAPGIRKDSALAAKEALVLTTIRSHDQYNTTVYGLDDRCQGVLGRRDVVFMNQEDLANRGLADGDQIEICGLLGDEESHSIGGLTAVAYDIPRGSVAGYHPEMNPVMSLSRFDPQSGTPSYTGVPVTVTRAAGIPISSSVVQ